MAANGGRHFEINTDTKNYKSQFIDQKQAYSYTFDKCDLCFLCKYTFYFMKIVFLEGLIGKKSISTVS